MVITIWKEFGETMTEVLDRCRQLYNTNEPMTYAGRLDPAASGIVIILSGEDRYHKNLYLGCDKQYSFEIIIGIHTDSGDIFGNIDKFEHITQLPSGYESSIKSLVGTSTNSLPSYSGYRFEGKPLWEHTITTGIAPIVTKTTTVYSIDSITTGIVHTKELKQKVYDLCNRPNLSGFRIDTIHTSWGQLLECDLNIITVTATVSSGTYIRTIAEKFGVIHSMPTCAYAITRIGVVLPTTETNEQKWITMSDLQ